jgi:hypothetical protein
LTKIIPSARPVVKAPGRPTYSEPAKITKPIGNGKAESSIRPQREAPRK